MRIHSVDDRGDSRGSAYLTPLSVLERLDRVMDLHYLTIRPGHTRGNHFHVDHDEALLVVYGDRWEFHWEDDKDAAHRVRAFEGSGAAVLEVDRGRSHAIVNSGGQDLAIVAMGSSAYTADEPDAFRRVIV